MRLWLAVERQISNWERPLFMLGPHALNIHVTNRRWISTSIQQLSKSLLPPSPSGSRSEPEPEPEPDFDAARQWHTRVGAKPVSSDLGEVSYARSSGPGGQNVNKVNSKAQLRISLDQLLPLLPTVLHHGIHKSPYYAGKTNSLLIQSDESRKQAANKESCFRKLNDLIIDLYHKTVPGETSDEQKVKVKKLQRAENEGRLLMKKKQSSKKAARQKGRGDE